MHRLTPRAGRWPLALTLAAVAACSDDTPTTAPRATPSSSSRDALDGNVILVTNANGGNVPGSLQWAVSMAGGTSVIQFDSSLAGDTIALDTTLEPFPYITIEGPLNKGITLTSNAGRVIRLRQGGVLRNLTISGGSDSPGSGVYAQGPVLIENTTVSDNHGLSSAIHAHEITLVNSTVSGNTGGSTASAISIPSVGTLVLINSTVAHNAGARAIGWAMSPGGPPLVTLRNSIVANNGSSYNCDDMIDFVHQGMNISSDSTCGVSPALLVADPMLMGLANNGGPTPTERFAYQSPALDAGVNCSVTVDQRYVSRGASCDIGAFEFTDFTVVTLAIDPNANVTAAAGAATVTGTVACSRTGEQFGVRVQLEQQQKVGKTTITVQGTGSATVNCTTSAQPWSAVVVPSTGAFAAGTGTAGAQTINTAKWVTPSSAARSVKLLRARK